MSHDCGADKDAFDVLICPPCAKAEQVVQNLAMQFSIEYIKNENRQKIETLSGALAMACAALLDREDAP